MDVTSVDKYPLQGDDVHPHSVLAGDLVDLADTWHEKMAEEAAQASEELMDRYLQDGGLDEHDIVFGQVLR